MKSKIAALMVSLLAFKASADDTCLFFSHYAEAFYNEKNVSKLAKDDAIDSVIHVVTSSQSYLVLNSFEQESFNAIIRDLGNQIYADDSKSVDEAKRKSVAYCRHMQSEVNRTQATRIKYCQKKGNNAELIARAANNGIPKDDLVTSLSEGLGGASTSMEYFNVREAVDDIYKAKEKTPSLSPVDIGRVTYNKCIAERG